MLINSEKKKRGDEKTDLVTCYIRVLFYFQCFVWGPEEIPLTGLPTLCS